MTAWHELGAMMRPDWLGLYTLDAERVPQPCPDTLAWGSWMEGSDRLRRVALQRGPHFTVSTVFLGLDQNYGSGPPVLFETIVFFNGQVGPIWRYCSWDEAAAGHAHLCAPLARMHLLYPAPAPSRNAREGRYDLRHGGRHRRRHQKATP